MGKSSKLKVIRQMARELPNITVMQKIGAVLFGREMIAQFKKQGAPENTFEGIDPKKQYRVKKNVPADLNHYDKMKNAYIKFGWAGVDNYVAAVNNFVAQQPKNKSND